MWVNPHAKIGLKSHENQSAYNQNLILQVGGGADAGAPDLRTELILSVERNVFMAKNVYFFGNVIPP